METTGKRQEVLLHWALATVLFTLAGAWLLAAGCGGGGGGGPVTNEQKAQVTGLFTGMNEGTEAAAGLETFSSGISNLYVYIPTSPYRSRAGLRQTPGEPFTDEEGNVWNWTENPDGSGSATTTYLNGVDTGTQQASVEWSAVTVDPVTGDEHWSYSYSAADGSSATMNFTFGGDGSISLEATATYIDPDTEVTYSMSFTMSIPDPATLGFIMTMNVDASDGTSLYAEFTMSADGNQVMTSTTFTDASGYSITTTETITYDPGPPETLILEYTFNDSEGYSGDLTLNLDGSGQGHIRDPNGDLIATIDIAAGGSPITITYRDGTSETLNGAIASRALKLLKR